MKQKRGNVGYNNCFGGSLAVGRRGDKEPASCPSPSIAPGHPANHCEM